MRWGYPLWPAAFSSVLPRTCVRMDSLGEIHLHLIRRKHVNSSFLGITVKNQTFVIIRAPTTVLILFVTGFPSKGSVAQQDLAIRHDICTMGDPALASLFILKVSFKSGLLTVFFFSLGFLLRFLESIPLRPIVPFVILKRRAYRLTMLLDNNWYDFTFHIQGLRPGRRQESRQILPQSRTKPRRFSDPCRTRPG